MKRFIDKICGNFTYDPSKVIGYSKIELGKIERLYDINVTKQLKDFLLDMGRSDGGLIGDDPIILFRSAWPVRAQISFQMEFFSLMQDSQNFEYLKHKPFVFSLESETQYFYVRTAFNNPDKVFHFDENTGKVHETEWDFLDYMKCAVEVWGNKSATICHGELVVI